MSYRIRVAAGMILALAIPSASPAQESDFLARFEGNWQGSGLVQRKAEENPTEVRCDMRGSNSANQVSIGGTCRAYLIFSRQIGADIQFDPGSGRYTGTFTGSVVGPARLSGRRSGDAVVMTITWPTTVNGDTTANMQIENAGNGSLRIVVSDEIAGKNTVTTNLTLTK